MLSRTCCPRVAKEGREMLNAGIEASFLQMSMPDAFRAILPNQFYYLSKEDLGPKIKALAPDVIHAHAEPAWLAGCIRRP